MAWDSWASIAAAIRPCAGGTNAFIRLSRVQLARSSLFAAHQIQAFVQLAAGAFASLFAADPPANQQSSPHQASLVDPRGQLQGRRDAVRLADS